MSLRKAVEKGRRPGLVALRDTLADAIEAAVAANPDARNVASLAGKLHDVLNDLAAIDAEAPQEANPVDRVAEQRAKRLADTSLPKRPAVGD